jgi:hypothetical protein
MVLASCFRRLPPQGENDVVSELLASPRKFLRSAPEIISWAIAGISSEPGDETSSRNREQPVI